MASGLSERMGTNKLLMDLKGKQLYQWTFDLLEEVAFDEVIIVSSYEEILEDAKNRGFKAIFNDNNQVGKSASIKLGVDAVDGENAMMFFVADQPLLTADTVNKLIDAYEKNPIITYPRTDKRRGAPVIFPNSYREGLLGLKYDEGGMKLVGGEDKNEVYIEDVSELWDVDTYNNLEEIREKYE